MLCLCARAGMLMPWPMCGHTCPDLPVHSRQGFFAVCPCAHQPTVRDSLIGSQTLQMHATTSGIYVDSGSWTQALKLHGRCSAHQVDLQPGPSVLVFLSRDMISGRASPHPLLLCFIMKRWLHMAPAVFYLKSIKTDGKVGRGRERGSVTQAHRNKDPEW